MSGKYQNKQTEVTYSYIAKLGSLVLVPQLSAAHPPITNSLSPWVTEACAYIQRGRVDPEREGINTDILM